MKYREIKWQEFIAMRMKEGKKLTPSMDELANITAQSRGSVWNWKKGTHKPTKAAQRLLTIWWYLPEQARQLLYK